ncbi:MAG: amino acid ABC transporter substrate-binding protein [Ruminiclostridium sp.]
MKKLNLKALAAAMAAVLTLGVAGCSTQATSSDASSDNGSAVSADDQSLQKVKDAGKLILGLDATFKPMGYTDENNEIVGFDIDVAEEVCKRLGVELVKQPINWDTLTTDLNVGKCDCVWNGLSINEERQEKMNLSEPYMKNAMVFVVKGDSAVEKMADLKGKKISVQNGSSAQTILESCEIKDDITISPIATNVEALQQLELGVVDAVFLDEVVADYEIKNSGKNYKKLAEGLEEEEYAIAFRKDDQALRDAVQQTLSEMKADGKLAEISTNWFGSDITIVK